ncbi:hypothetical protein FS815_24545 [Agrobacterium vitis]|uniref:hypothetical protein n=1 Tax=Allorhizobium ampelinum TaxID=3025782 RepID=UPI001F467CFD|nr:hypothetical protein [Allorhizobium ampelinum]MCF1449963.1 hypothetical protein [Allorhizobium ampelinum]
MTLSSKPSELLRALDARLQKAVALGINMHPDAIATIAKYLRVTAEISREIEELAERARHPASPPPIVIDDKVVLFRPRPKPGRRPPPDGGDAA